MSIMTSVFAICAVFVYGIYTFNERLVDLLKILDKWVERERVAHASGSSDSIFKPEQSKKFNKFEASQEPEAFSSAIARAASVKGFGNM
jgi:hypothetical protein